jgi:hypothetical protein
MIVKRTERGWAGHFCAADSCRFKRNTLLECGKTRIVISTVGDYHPAHKNGKVDIIGSDRYYETMAFNAMRSGVYWDADVGRGVSFNSDWCISEYNNKSDMEANDMHERVVKEISKRISNQKQKK